MKSVILIIIFFLSFSFHSIAQDNDSELFVPHVGWIGLIGSYAITSGDYASTVKSSTSGFAKNSFSYKADIVIPVSGPVGILASASGGSNDIDVTAYANKPLGSPTAVLVNDVSWSYYGGLLGLYLKSPVRNFPVYLKFQMGYYYGTSPPMSFTITNSQGKVYINQDAKSVWAISYCAGGGFIIPMSSTISLLLNVDFLTFTADYKSVNVNVTSYPGNIVPNGNTQVSGSQSFNILNLGAGLAFLMN